MSRSSSWTRQQEAAARAAMRDARETERMIKALQKAKIAEQKEQFRRHLMSRQAEVDDKNAALEESIQELSKILIDGLDRDCRLNFAGMRVKPEVPKLELGALAEPTKAPIEFQPPPVSPLLAWIPPIKRNHEAALAKAKAEYDAAYREYLQKEGARQKAIAEKKNAHAARAADAQRVADAKNAEVEALRAAYEKADPGAIGTYAELVLMSSPLREDFPQVASAAYIPESKQLLVEYDLPGIDAVVPTVKAYKFVKANDSISESPRPDSQRRSLYTSIVGQTVLRCLYELFSSDEHGFIETIVLNAHVDAIDRGTGKRVRPCIVTVRTTKDAFDAIDLRHVEASACLRTLNAGVSKSPSELVPVRPILEFKMVDPRFVKEEDVLSTLDQRPNLMDLKPTEFESLITNLFQKMGLETKLTQASRDGGVDCVAYDPRPIFGGKVIIQAKRYKNTVGVSAVRDLFGTMQNEGASKGILVTTSGYGKAAFDFAANKPMELLGGSNLLYLLQQHAGVEAKIVMPEEWKDPVPDSPE